ncbi:MAG: efflux RND transporter permease subunit [Gemmatimonadota bacterium]
MTREQPIRRVVAVALSFAVVMSGAVALRHFSWTTDSVSERAELDVTAAWIGASSLLVEGYVTSPLETVIQPVSGVLRTRSESRPGLSHIAIVLRPDADVRLVRLAIQERLELVRTSLPTGCSQPVVAPYVSEGANKALLEIAVTGPFTIGELSRIADVAIIPRIRAVAGIGAVERFGGAARRIVVRLQPARLRSLGIDPVQIDRVIAQARIAQPLGVVNALHRNISVVARDEPASLEELANLPIPHVVGNVVRLADVAAVRYEEDAQGAFQRIDGRDAVRIVVAQTHRSNVRQLDRTINALLDSVRATVATSVQIRVLETEGARTAGRFRSKLWSAAVALGAMMVLFALLTSSAWKMLTVIWICAVSLAISSIALYLLKTSLTSVALEAACVVIPLTIRHSMVHAVAPLLTSAKRRVRPFQPLIISLIATCSVCLPIIWLAGTPKELFLSLVVCYVVVEISSSVASMWLGSLLVPSKRIASSESRAERVVAELVVLSVKFRGAVICMVISVLVVGVISLREAWISGPAFRTLESRTSVLVSVAFPRGTDSQALDNTIQSFERIVIGRQGVDQVVASGRRESALLRVFIDPDVISTSVPVDIRLDLLQQAQSIGGAMVAVMGFGPGFSVGSDISPPTFRLIIRGFSYAAMDSAVADLTSRLRQNARVRDVRVDDGSLSRTGPTFDVTLTPQRRALRRLSLSPVTLSEVLAREVQGPVAIQHLVLGAQEYDVVIKAEGAESRSVEELGQVLLSSKRSGVRIRDVASVGEQSAPGVIIRDDQQYVRGISYEFRGAPRLASKFHRAFLAGTQARPGFSIQDAIFDGQGDQNAQQAWLMGGVGVLLMGCAAAVIFDCVQAALLTLLGGLVVSAGLSVALIGFSGVYQVETPGALLIGVSFGMQIVTLVLCCFTDAELNRGGVYQTCFQFMLSVRQQARQFVLALSVVCANLLCIAPFLLIDDKRSSQHLFIRAIVVGTGLGCAFAFYIIPLVSLSKLSTRRRFPDGGSINR